MNAHLENAILDTGKAEGLAAVMKSYIGELRFTKESVKNAEYFENAMYALKDAIEKIGMDLELLYEDGEALDVILAIKKKK